MTRAAIKTYLFKPGLPQELEVVSLKETLRRSRAMITEPHRADFYQLIWIAKGKATLLLDFASIPMPAGSLLCVRKDRVLMYDRASTYDGKAILFTDAFLAREPRFLRESPLFAMANAQPLLRIPASERRPAALLELIERELAAPADAARAPILQDLLHAFLLQAGRLLIPETRPREPDRAAGELARRFLDALESGYRRDRQVSIYATLLGVPEKRLQAATAAACGKAPKALIEERVALEAKRLLLFGAASVKEICFDLGFDETTNFVKWFRKHAGTTPAAFRSRYQA